MAIAFDASDSYSFQLDGIKAGDVVKVGGIIGVAETDSKVKEDGKQYTTVRFGGQAVVALDGTPKAGDAVGVADSTADGKVTVSTTGVKQLFGFVLNPAKSVSGGYTVAVVQGRI